MCVVFSCGTVVLQVLLSIVVLFYVSESYMLIAARARLFFFQAEDGIRDLVRSRGLGDVYKRQCS